MNKWPKQENVNALALEKIMQMILILWTPQPFITRHQNKPGYDANDVHIFPSHLHLFFLDIGLIVTERSHDSWLSEN